MKVKIIGGLGNQMFQYATAFAIAKRTNQNLVVDISDAVSYKTHPLRLTALSCSCEYEYKSNYFEKYIYSTIIPYSIRKLIFCRHYIENGLSYDDTIDTKSINKKIIGYFQTEKYFKEFRGELISEFKPREAFSEYQSEILNLIKQQSCCSIHIRRGDYISNVSANNTHGVCNSEYFKKAIKYLENSGVVKPGIALFVFSDDIEWCKENISFPYKTIFVKGDEEKVELDMWLMSFCDHNIISNSSFSWWGAWLNENAEKYVIAPSQWFRKNIQHDIIPASWIKI